MKVKVILLFCNFAPACNCSARVCQKCNVCLCTAVVNGITAKNQPIIWWIKKKTVHLPRWIGQLCLPLGRHLPRKLYSYRRLSRLFNDFLKLRNFHDAVSEHATIRASLMIIYHAHHVCHFLFGYSPHCGPTPKEVVYRGGACKSIITMWVCVARSTVSGSEDLRKWDE